MGTDNMNLAEKGPDDGQMMKSTGWVVQVKRQGSTASVMVEWKTWKPVAKLGNDQMH
jgi:hypothetical protein